MKNNRFIAFMESFIMIMIALVMIQTFLEDFVILADWPVFIRKILIITAFAFDLIFTVEFLVRFFAALLKKEAAAYFFRNRGWVDLLSAVPLLLLNSGPGLYALITGTVFGGGFSIISILKIVKAIRIARMLRMLRFLKVFRRIKFADSPMAQRHMTRITTTVVSFFILVLVGVNLMFTFLPIGDIEENQEKISHGVAEYIASEPIPLKDRSTLVEYSSRQTNLLRMDHNGKTIYSRHDTQYFARQYTNSDYTVLEKPEGWRFFFDGKPLMKRHSRENLIFFAVITGIIVSLMLFYSPHFAFSVSDPVNIMVRGMSEKSYNLEVKIPAHLGEDDLFQLAKRYNEDYLPMKARIQSEGHEGAPLDISLDDIQDLFKQG